MKSKARCCLCVEGRKEGRETAVDGERFKEEMSTFLYPISHSDALLFIHPMGSKSSTRFISNPSTDLQPCMISCVHSDR